MKQQVIEFLAESKGIATVYLDSDGNEVNVEPALIENALRCMGYSTHDDNELAIQAAQEVDQYWLTALNPVYIVEREQDWEFEVRLPIEFVNDELVLIVELENGGQQEFMVTPILGALVGSHDINEGEFQAYHLELEQSLPLGYHTVSLYERNVPEPLGVSLLIVTPEKAYVFEPDRSEGSLENNLLELILPSDTIEVKGMTVDACRMHSGARWGMVDFRDLQLFAKHVFESQSQNNFEFVGFDLDSKGISPEMSLVRYGMASISFINIEKVVGFAQSKQVQTLYQSDSYQQSLAELRQQSCITSEHIHTLTQLKIDLLMPLYTWFIEHKTQHETLSDEFNVFQENCDVALLNVLKKDLLASKSDKVGLDAFIWMVWLAERQFTALKSLIQLGASQCGAGQYDICLPFELESSLVCMQARAELTDDATSNNKGEHHLFFNQLKIGKSEGCDTDVPVTNPLNIGELYKQAFKPLVIALQNVMSKSSIIKLPPLMTLLHRWVEPVANDLKIENKEQGVYVYYPFSELLAIIKLESQRNNCSVIFDANDGEQMPDELLSQVLDEGFIMMSNGAEAEDEDAETVTHRMKAFPLSHMLNENKTIEGTAKRYTQSLNELLENDAWMTTPFPS
ncbi:4-alpha-glucanotransferase [Flocculibacter collagenilyticus]|uniref:hypothetical protein n=1 Tax=Flocculibacter collagenilyticus TaxID=2744479 RepID=UPI0018F501BD|nr:hypothetical protein [Flocculibacter collagenilyticus]